MVLKLIVVKLIIVKLIVVKLGVSKPVGDEVCRRLVFYSQSDMISGRADGLDAAQAGIKFWIIDTGLSGPAAWCSAALSRSVADMPESNGGDGFGFHGRAR
jgi:hypothetical protein